MESNAAPTAQPHSNAWIAHVGLFLILAYFGIVYRSVIFTTEGVIERDGFYHARYAQMLPQRGLSRELPWMQFTDWKEHFCDKDFLYHVYLAPFTLNAAEPLPGAKYATLILLLGTLGAMYFVLKKWNVPFALIWVALAGVASAHFIQRMLMVRSHCLSVLLLVLATHFILKRRFWPCFALGFVYAWSYSSPAAMLIAACAAEIGCQMVAREFKSCWRIPLATAAGLLAGLVIHPYTPYALKSFMMMAEITLSGVKGSEVELGSEFRRMTFDSAFTVSIGSMLAALIALGGGIALLFGAIKNRKLSPESAAMVAISTAWLVIMFVFFERFIEYACPTACLALGFVARDLIGNVPSIRKLEDARRTTVLAGFGAAAMVLTGLHAYTLFAVQVAYNENSLPALPPMTIKPTEAEIIRWHRGRFFDGAAGWMRANVKPGSTVANFYWDDFPELFYSAPEFHYLVGLDPTLMRLAHRDDALALEAMRFKVFPPGSKLEASQRERKPIDFGELHERFGTEYTIMRRYRAQKYPELFDPLTRRLKVNLDHAELVYPSKDAVDADSEAVIYCWKK